MQEGWGELIDGENEEEGDKRYDIDTVDQQCK